MTRLSNNEEQQAQHIACSHLVRGCEGAVSELQHVNGKAKGQSPTMVRAGDILAQVLSSWQDALKVLTPGEESGSAPAEANLDGWTSDELFTEALARTAGDVPALRLMQDVVLEARLTAHDRESAHEHVEG